jgi:2-isopropylmalate synthase
MKITIFDTTLRDGEQSSGFHMFTDEKMAIAGQLAKLGVDVIEAGFAASSPGDWQSVNSIAKDVGAKGGPVICSLARAVDRDIEAAASAIEPAYKQRIHTFIATSDIHINGKFKKSKQWVTDTAAKAVQKAKSYADDVEFSTEDFGRSEPAYIVDIVCAAIGAGATTINLPDTVGWMAPIECYEKVRHVIDMVRQKGFDAVFSVHNHNDFGMATATTIAAIMAGASQAEVTVNGIGERAGNASLEEVVAILREKGMGETGINTRMIGETSRMVSRYTGIVPQPNKAIVGRNAFAHEAGIHQDGVIKDAKTYETMDPADYGVESVITFGPRSGRNALKAKFRSMGIELTDELLQKAAETFTSIADNAKEIDDADIIRSVSGKEIPEYYRFIDYTPMRGFSAEVVVQAGEDFYRATGRGNGLIDAAIKAVKEITKSDYKLIDFKVTSQCPGSDAKGLSRVVASDNGWRVIGKADDTDVVTSAIRAYIGCCNRMRFVEEHFS